MKIFLVWPGPIPTTTGDYFEMIWEQKTVVIVMVTNNVEVSGVKCYQYWPMNAGESLVYGNFVVKTTALDVHEYYTVSTLEITNSVVNIRTNSKMPILN